MTSHRRVSALLALIVAVLAILLPTAATAGAAPYSGSPTLSISASTPCKHATVTAAGTGYTPGSTVVLTVEGTVLGTVTVGKDGTFTTRVTFPIDLFGPVTIVGNGGAGNTASASIVIDSSCTAGVSASAGDPGTGGGAAGGGSTGGLSSTGVAVLGLLVVAVGLVGTGLVLLLGGRRRRTA